MNKTSKLEDEAIMNLLYLGQDQQQSPFINGLAHLQSRPLGQARHKFKSNTIHLKNIKNSLNSTQIIPPIKPNPQQNRYQHSKNKENLKKILEKLQNSPSPSHKAAQNKQKATLCQIKTQKSQQVSKSKSKYNENRTPKISKKQFDRLFDKKKDKQFIKSLIKAKIVQKLKKIEHKKSENKIYSSFVAFMDHSTQPSLKRFDKQRVVTLRSEQSAEKTKYTTLLRQQRFINTSLFSRKNSQVNLKTLLF